MVAGAVRPFPRVRRGPLATRRSVLLAARRLVSLPVPAAGNPAPCSLLQTLSLAPLRLHGDFLAVDGLRLATARQHRVAGSDVSSAAMGELGQALVVDEDLQQRRAVFAERDAGLFAEVEENLGLNLRLDTDERGRVEPGGELGQRDSPRGCQLQRGRA